MLTCVCSPPLSFPAVVVRRGRCGGGGGGGGGGRRRRRRRHHLDSAKLTVSFHTARKQRSA